LSNNSSVNARHLAPSFASRRCRIPKLTTGVFKSPGPLLEKTLREGSFATKLHLPRLSNPAVLSTIAQDGFLVGLPSGPKVGQPYASATGHRCPARLDAGAQVGCSGAKTLTRGVIVALRLPAQGLKASLKSHAADALGLLACVARF
jgi:hypothetical protein